VKREMRYKRALKMNKVKIEGEKYAIGDRVLHIGKVMEIHEEPESTPNPTESITEEESTPNPTESITEEESTPNPTESTPNPTESTPNPTESISEEEPESITEEEPESISEEEPTPISEKKEVLPGTIMSKWKVLNT